MKNQDLYQFIINKVLGESVPVIWARFPNPTNAIHHLALELINIWHEDDTISLSFIPETMDNCVELLFNKVYGDSQWIRERFGDDPNWMFIVNMDVNHEVYLQEHRRNGTGGYTCNQAWGIASVPKDQSYAEWLTDIEEGATKNRLSKKEVQVSEDDVEVTCTNCNKTWTVHALSDDWSEATYFGLKPGDLWCAECNRAHVNSDEYEGEQPRERI